MPLTEETGQLILKELARIAHRLDVLTGVKEELTRAEAIRQTHDNPKALQDYLKTKRRS